MTTTTQTTTRLTLTGTEIRVGDRTFNASASTVGKRGPELYEVIKAEQKQHELGARYQLLTFADGTTSEAWDGFDYTVDRPAPPQYTPMDLTDFDSNDWKTWAGAEHFETDGDEPKIATILVDYDGWVEITENTSDEGPEHGGLPEPDENGYIPLDLIADNSGIRLNDQSDNCGWIGQNLTGKAAILAVAGAIASHGTIDTHTLATDFGLRG